MQINSAAFIAEVRVKHEAEYRDAVWMFARSSVQVPRCVASWFFPCPSRVLGTLQKAWTRGLRTKGGTWRTEGKKAPHWKEEKELKFYKLRWSFSNLVFLGLKNTVNQAHIAARRLQASSLEKPNNLKGGKINCYSYLEESPDEMAWSLPISSMVMLTSCKVLPKHKRFWIRLLLILGKPLLERQRWKQL